MSEMRRMGLTGFNEDAFHAENQRLARLCRRGRNKDALHQLVVRNLQLVVSIAKNFQGLGLDLEDLIQWGNYGLMEAAKKFKPERKVHFASCAVVYIRKYLWEGVYKESGPIKIAIKRQQLWRRIWKYHAEGLPPLGKIAWACRTSVAEVKEALDFPRGSIPTSGLTSLADARLNPQEALLRKEIDRNKLQDLRHRVREVEPNERNREIFFRKYDLEREEIHTNLQVARLYGVSESLVGDIVLKIRRRLEGKK